MFVRSLNFFFQACDAMMGDAETKELMNRSFDLVIMDGAFPECALGMAYKYGVPFMYINTVGFYTGSLSIAGNPSMWSTTPAFYKAFTDDMNIFERGMNTFFHLFVNAVHTVCNLVF